MKTLGLAILTALVTLAICGFIAVRRQQAEKVQADASIAETTEHNHALTIGFYSASRVYGRCGCGDERLAVDTALWAIERGIDPAILAAVVAVESRGDPLAVSKSGAVGLMQIHVATWKGRWNFARENLFDGDTNMRIGSTLLAELITKHGVEKGLVRYNGDGAEARQYAAQVMRLVKESK